MVQQKRPLGWAFLGGGSHLRVHVAVRGPRRTETWWELEILGSVERAGELGPLSLAFTVLIRAESKF